MAGEGGGGGEQVVEVEGGPEGEVEDAGADGFEGVGERGEALAAETLRPEHKAHADPKANQYPGHRPYPALLDRKLQRPARGEEQSNDSDAVEDLGAEAVFEGLSGLDGRWYG